MNQGQGNALPGLLTIVFVVLKLTGTIHWSWLWVTSPIWITWLVGLAFMGVIKLLEKHA